MTAYWKSDQLMKGPSRKQSRSQARKIYRAVTESARNDDGFLICSLCGAPGDDLGMIRDHIRTRGSGGKTSPENVRILCLQCHDQRHLSPRLPGQPS